MATPLSTLAAAPAAGEMALLVMLPVDGLVMIIQTSPLRTIVELEDFIVAEFARVFPDRPALPTPIRIQKCMPLTLVADRRKHQATSDKSDRHSFVELSKTLQVGNAFQAMEQAPPADVVVDLQDESSSDEKQEEEPKKKLVRRAKPAASPSSSAASAPPATANPPPAELAKEKTTEATPATHKPIRRSFQETLAAAKERIEAEKRAAKQQAPNLSSTPSAVKSNELPKPATPDETAPPTDKPVKQSALVASAEAPEELGGVSVACKAATGVGGCEPGAEATEGVRDFIAGDGGIGRLGEDAEEEDGEGGAVEGIVEGSMAASLPRSRPTMLTPNNQPGVTDMTAQDAFEPHAGKKKRRRMKQMEGLLLLSRLPADDSAKTRAALKPKKAHVVLQPQQLQLLYFPSKFKLHDKEKATIDAWFLAVYTAATEFARTPIDVQFGDTMRFSAAVTGSMRDEVTDVLEFELSCQAVVSSRHPDEPSIRWKVWRSAAELQAFDEAIRAVPTVAPQLTAVAFPRERKRDSLFGGLRRKFVQELREQQFGMYVENIFKCTTLSDDMSVASTVREFLKFDVFYDVNDCRIDQSMRSNVGDNQEQPENGDPVVHTQAAWIDSNGDTQHFESSDLCTVPDRVEPISRVESEDNNDVSESPFLRSSSLPDEFFQEEIITTPETDPAAAKRLHKQILRLVRELVMEDEDRVRDFQDQTKDYGRDKITGAAYCSFLLGALGAKHCCELIPMMVRLLPDDDKRRELLDARTLYFDVNKNRSFKSIVNTAKEIAAEMLPIQCLEAVFLAAYITASFSDLDRFPLSFKSQAGNSVHRHIVLAVRHQNKWGALGLSRSERLMYKELRFSSLSELTQDFCHGFESVCHSVTKLHVGFPFPHDIHSSEKVEWRVLNVPVDTVEWSIVATHLDAFAKEAADLLAFRRAKGAMPDSFGNRFPLHVAEKEPGKRSPEKRPSFGASAIELPPNGSEPTTPPPAAVKSDSPEKNDSTRSQSCPILVAPDELVFKRALANQAQVLPTNVFLQNMTASVFVVDVDDPTGQLEVPYVNTQIIPPVRIYE
ncbi:hypothetical protein ATCC90586_005275 [Pythium insidiosum]|nr:hypothetical protein ATCC90586_005275 [Pythium insidiosum]